ncbi:MAG: MBL fold metallo-hydrolase [Firmicutes bacterium]|nr:MBL fold metallo-hydrolase [Bacillota bacterium]
MYLKPFFVKGLAHISYLVGAGTQCAVIDPSRDVQVYIDEAKNMGFRITHILETHLHADFISGHLDLAEKTGAVIVGPKSGNMQFGHTAVSENDEFFIQNLKFRVLETPGHTPEHLSYVVYDASRGEEPCSVFTGDTLFVGDAGRPDLFPGRADELTEKLYHSLEKLKNLPDFTEVYPAHGAGSLCGKAISAKRSSTMGYEKKYNPTLQDMSIDEFKAKLLSGMPEAPDHFSRCSETNRQGPALLRELPSPVPFSPADFKKFYENNNSIILDVRNFCAFCGGHIPGAINIDIGSNFPTFAGWILPVGKPILLITDCENDMEKALTGLRQVGLDNVAGWLEGGIYNWNLNGYPIASIPQISVEKLKEDCVRQKAFIIDVRSRREFDSYHLEKAVNIPVPELRTRYSEIKNEPIIVMCASGQRSAMAAGILRSAGIVNVVNVPGGITAWRAAGYTEKCPVDNIHGPGFFAE